MFPRAPELRDARLVNVRTRAAMAALDRRNLNLDDFAGLNWSCWVDRVNILSSDAGCNAEDSKNGTDAPETMTLRKEDMHIFGRCPAHDEFFLVVCSHCGLVVKPQAFEKHCEKWHGPVTWMCGRSAAQAARRQTSPSPSASPFVRRQRDGGDVSTVPVSGPRSRTSKDHKETAGSSSVKLSEEKPPVLHPTSSMPHSRVPPGSSTAPPPGHSSSSTPPSDRRVQKPPAGPSTEPPCSLRGLRTYGRTNKSLNKKESEQNGPFSGLDPEKKKMCSQELMSKTIPSQLTLPSESGKSHAVEELRKAPEARDGEQLPLKSKHKNDVVEKKSTQGGSCSFSSNILRSKNPSENFPVGKGGSAVEPEVKPQFSFSHSLLSSEGSEEEEEDEAGGLPATAWHPKPLGLCTFGCRTLGCSIFTFDRRLHRLRFALSAMLERHVNTHMWKKMPQASPALRAHRVTGPIIGPAVRTGDKLSRSPGSFFLDSPSVGKLETKSPQNPHDTKRPFPSSTAAGPAPVRRCDLAGKSRTGQPRKEAADRRRGGEEKSSGCIRDRTLHEKSQPRAFSSSTSRGSPPPVKKPCRPLSLNPPGCSSLAAPAHCTARSRRRPPGAPCGVLDYDHRSFVQKRKGSGDSPAPAPPMSKTPKYKCLSSPSRSGIVSMETIEDVLSWGLEKRADA